MNVRVLRIYDRWGELVFEKYDFPLNDYFSGWDGTFRKKKAMPGVYACYVEFKTYLGAVEKKFGDVTLLR